MKELTRADEEIHAIGKNIEELFEKTALALTEIMVNTKTLGTKKKKSITITAQNEEDLLFQFLEEIITLKDSEQLLFKNFKCQVANLKSGVSKLTCTSTGDTINEKQELRTDIKGITRHEYKLKKTKKGWETTIVVDV